MHLKPCPEVVKDVLGQQGGIVSRDTVLQPEGLGSRSQLQQASTLLKILHSHSNNKVLMQLCL